MRQLSARELDQVKRAIAAKDLTSAEILMEVYDHYVSHLESVETYNFDEELFELEHKFKYSYCHALQAKFNKEIRKDLGKLHWKIFQRNFRLPRIIYILGVMACAFYLSSHIGNGKQATLLMVFPLLILTVFNLYYLTRSNLRTKQIKRLINQKKAIHSSLYYPISERMYLPVLIVYPILWISDLIFDIQVTSELTPQIASTFSTLLFIYVASLVEIWNIKSKTALI